jgi:hypothetical protein
MAAVMLREMTSGGLVRVSVKPCGRGRKGRRGGEDQGWVACCLLRGPVTCHAGPGCLLRVRATCCSAGGFLSLKQGSKQAPAHSLASYTVSSSCICRRQLAAHRNHKAPVRHCSRIHSRSPRAQNKALVTNHQYTNNKPGRTLAAVCSHLDPRSVSAAIQEHQTNPVKK